MGRCEVDNRMSLKHSVYMADVHMISISLVNQFYKIKYNHNTFYII